jgi:type IV pilus assembly protein PilC
MMTKEELSVLSRQLSLVVSSDLPLQEGMDLIIEQSVHSEQISFLKRVKKSIQDGNTLGQAISEEKKTIPGFYSDMIRIGEESGNLPLIFLRIAEAYEKDIKTAKKVRSAVTYPIVLSFLMLGVIVLLVTTVMPMFKDILLSLGGDIPPLTDLIVNTAIFLGDNIILILGAIIVVFLTFDIYRNTKSGRIVFDKLKLHLPIQKEIIVSIAALRFSRNMAMLIKSGIPASTAVDMVRPLLGNSTLSKKMENAAAQLREGMNLKEVLGKLDLFPSLLLKLLSVAESTGHIVEMFDKAADIMDDELDGKLDRLTTVLEPLLIIFLSVILGAILLSVIFPVISIMNSIG